MRTNVYSSQEIQASLHQIKTHISGVIKSNQTTLSRSNDKATVQTSLQALFSSVFAEDLTNSIYMLFLRYALDAERKSPGSFLLFAKLLIKHDVPLKEQLVTRPCNRADVEERIDRIVKDERVNVAVKEAIELSGMLGKVLIEKTTSTSNIVVEKSSGYVFFAKRPFRCVSVHVHPRVMCIDGFVDNVSEIQQLLSDAAETKERVMFFCRGMSEDVNNTIRVNNLKGLLTVIPYEFKIDVMTLNTLNDIAVVCGTDVVSSNKGELISNARLCDAPTVEKITVYDDRFVISNRKTKENVAAHLRAINEKRMTSAYEKMYDDRIKSLTDSCVTVKLPDDMSYVVDSQSIDYVLRSLVHMAKSGVVSKSDESAFVGELSDTAQCALSAHEAFFCVVGKLGACVTSCERRSLP